MQTHPTLVTQMILQLLTAVQRLQRAMALIRSIAIVMAWPHSTRLRSLARRRCRLSSMAAAPRCIMPPSAAKLRAGFQLPGEHHVKLLQLTPQLFAA